MTGSFLGSWIAICIDLLCFSEASAHPRTLPPLQGFNGLQSSERHLRSIRQQLAVFLFIQVRTTSSQISHYVYRITDANSCHKEIRFYICLVLEFLLPICSRMSVATCFLYLSPSLQVFVAITHKVRDLFWGSEVVCCGDW